jgi:uncharacterized protein YbaR (Trm112 family)
MFIELTDHLRCPAEHTESFLVLIPDEMNGREVVRGVLGCPVCQREYPIREGVVHFREGTADSPEPPSGIAVNAGAIAAFLGLEGPGGFVGLIGEAAGFAPELSARLPGIHLVAVNPPGRMPLDPSISLLLSPGIPFKHKSLRGIVLGRPFGGEAGWAAGALQAVLPGLRAVGHGPTPGFDGFDLLGEAEGWWVGKKRWA